MMYVTFQTTDGRLFKATATAKEVKEFWTINKKQIRWCNVYDEEGQNYFWHVGHKYWQHFDRLDEKQQAACRRLLAKYYMEAFNNGMVMEYVARLNNQS